MIVDHLEQNPAAAWVKRYYVASRALMDATLRPYDLGATQWYVLWQLATNGPTVQRDFLSVLQVEKATLSEVVTALVRKGFVTQSPVATDQRQRLVTLTPAGAKLWEELPDPIDLILTVSFDGVDESELATVVQVLRAATERLTQHLAEGNES
jgi:DNA-binding MarR family transcriptional regulator